MNEEFDQDEPTFGCELPAFDPSIYPRSYRPSPIWLVLQVAGSLVLLAAGVALLAASAFPRELARLPQWAVSLPAGLGLLLLGVAGLLDAWRTRVVLHADAVEVRGLLRSRTLALGAIVGRRGQPQGLGWVSTRLVVKP